MWQANSPLALAAAILLQSPCQTSGNSGEPRGQPTETANSARNLCLEIADAARCQGSAGVEGGWRLLHRLYGAPPLLAAVLGAVWLMILSFPVGVTTPAVRGALVLGAGLAVLGVLVSWWSPWLSPHSPALLAPLMGTWAGSWVRRRIRGNS